MSSRGSFAGISERLGSDPLELAALISSAVTTAGLSLQFLMQRQYAMALWAIPIPALSLFAVIRVIRRVKGQLLPLKVFAGVQQLSETWPRHEISMDIADHLRRAAGEAMFLTGRSGAGKSTLFRTEIKPAFERDGWNVVVISNYVDPVVGVASALASFAPVERRQVRDLTFDRDCIASESRFLLIVFDQLEQLAAHPVQVQYWVRDFIGHILQNSSVRVAVIVRQEFLYEIRHLGSIVPSPHRLYEITGLDSRASTEDIRAALAALGTVAELEVVAALLSELTIDPARDSVAPPSGQILPVDLQLTGEVLEREWRKDNRTRVDRLHFVRLGGTRLSIMRQYFDTYIKASPYPFVTSTVLFALAVSPPPKALSIDHLAHATYSGAKSVGKVVTFLVEHRLVQSIDDNHFQLAHDALATLYREIASASLSVGVREAVSYGVDHAEVGVVRSSASARGHIRAATVVFVVMIGTIFVRFVLALFARGSSSPVSYLIVAPSHLAWAFFMYRLARNVFVRMPGLYAGLWVAFAIMGSISLAIAMVWPSLWVLAMGTTGLAVSGAFGIVARRALTQLGREEYCKVALNFLGVAATMIIGGYAFAAMMNGCMVTSSWLSIVSLAISLGFVFLSFTSTAKYAAERPALIWLSLMDRKW
jgi:hypothetical protein